MSSCLCPKVDSIPDLMGYNLDCGSELGILMGLCSTHQALDWLFSSSMRYVLQTSPYSRPLGPGAYAADVFAPQIGNKSGDQHGLRTPNKHQYRPSPCFSTAGRENSETLKANMFDSYNENRAPDYAHWNRKGCYGSRTVKNCNPAGWGPDPRIVKNPDDVPDR